jgi:hypothetical protein
MTSRQRQLLNLVAEGFGTACDLMFACGMSRDEADDALRKAAKRGLLVRVRRGRYATAEVQP